MFEESKDVSVMIVKCGRNALQLVRFDQGSFHPCPEVNEESLFEDKYLPLRGRILEERLFPE